MAGPEPALPPYLIVDGHSMVFAWEELATLHARSTSAARDELLRRLTTLQDMSGDQLVVVFDGVQVFYSPAGASADLVIERLAAKYARDRDITVASRDRAVLDTCSAFGALAISANALLERVERAEAELRRRL